ncbi:phosphatase PAP2 family protein [Qipengyuania sp. G39]|uniref:Phosphatase PAP2 family protein n=1 Tax=Qipengyuania profundimaris TaxID=3067652 RepID=A0ABT9HQJ4_9SPHN|nr:phosphatase PAP2 family protein [Qipengyuania sp. G39]MDP4575411.1 phosphatase PAP2 family protein [Qipengyuania sp. G39]
MQLSTLKTYIHREQGLLIGLLVGAALVGGFIKLAGEMLEDDTQAFDIAFLKSLRIPGDLATPIGPSWLLDSMRDITALGGVTVLTLVSALAIAFLLMRGRVKQALYTALATGGGAVMGKLLKSLFARERPEVVPHLVEVTSLSFPSGHSMNSAIVYLTLAVMISRSFDERRARIFTIGTAALLVLAIGFSRLYLGVHYPTDVLGGWTVGASWALAMGLIATRLQERHQIEEPGEDPVPA